MKHSVILIFVCSLLFACANEPEESGSQEAETIEVAEQSGQVVENESDRLPLIDNIDVEWIDNEFTAEAELLGRDANYYNAYVRNTSVYYAHVEGTNPNTSLIILTDEGEVLFRGLADNGPIEWSGTFDISGAAIFQVGLKAGTSTMQDKSEISIRLWKD